MKRLLALVLALLVGVHILSASESLRRPAAAIEESLLRLAPRGSSVEEVLRAIEAKGWKHDFIHETGFLKQEGSKPMEVVGKKSIHAHLGEYGLILKTSVDAFWGFDGEGKLLEVWVWKTTDGP
ncbi:MAG TPA: hypothetical protein VHD32_16835 [Candidatus Didemnitutus sp.]|nr:hypothetical protein [Candidatus Didemnitutus sp.]